MIKIMKASAGSGKTYHLALEYIRLLLASRDRYKYRSILAVTFTNKATDEMKSRILKELYILSTEPEQSDYLKEFVPSLFPDVGLLRKKAGACLSTILHDYSAFAVSTIDRFFQQALRAFSREIGQFSSYQVELDREGLVDETVDRILDDLTEEDGKMLDWLSGSVMSGLMNGNRFNLETELKSMARSLTSEQFRETVDRYRIDEERAFSMDRLKTVLDLCGKVVDRFTEKVRTAAREVLDVLSAEGVDPKDSFRGFLKGLYDYAEATSRTLIKIPSASFREKASDPSKWFSRSNQKMKTALEGVLDPVLASFLSLFETPYKEYRTAMILRGQVYSLGIAGTLREAFTALQKEKNILSIDDSNQILKSIIDGSDAPFVYEKLGVRFEDFLLDEFQDTSSVQWDNFRPLLLNSDAGGFDNLVVGDVKQSIYRWRGSDWNLLASGLAQEFPFSKETRLGCNYRTLKGIVDFNKGFFLEAAKQLDAMLGESCIEDLYADVGQEAKLADPAEGSVDLAFTPDTTSEMDEILATLSALRESGARYGDIAILVRNNAEGSAIATQLISAGIPVISDDSLFVKSSVTVRRLVSLLSLADTPETGDDRSVRGYLARTLAIPIPGSYHSLTDLSDTLLRSLREPDPGSFEAETAYIHAFMDTLSEWTEKNGNHLSAFLKYWEGENPKISSPEGGSSVRIMTIHKSKGLEFPYVIFAYAEKVGLFRSSPRWCRPAAGGTALSGLEDGIYPVCLSGQSDDTLFSRDYVRERRLQFIDNINLFYVAMTRAQYGLKVIAAIPARKREEDFSNMAQLLYVYASDAKSGMEEEGDETGTLRFRKGEMYDFGSMKRKPVRVKPVPLGYPSYPLNPEGAGERGRLRYSPEAADFFGPEGVSGPEASSRIRGIVLHRILSEVAVPEDLPAAVDRAVLRGEITRSEEAPTRDFLLTMIRKAPEEWFPEDCSRLLNEVTLLDPAWRSRGRNGSFENRPDRVVLTDRGTVVVDYKFGTPKPEYREQIRRYMTLFREMGHAGVRGYLWYLQEEGGDFFEEVSP